MIDLIFQTESTLHYSIGYNLNLISIRMAKRLNLKDKMEEINEKFSLKTKSSIANDVLENKLK